jgi:hypothetical protein
MAVSLKRTQGHLLGYTPGRARELARELGGTAVPAKFEAGTGMWQIGGTGSSVGLAHIVVLPLPIGRPSKITYVVLADNTAPVKTADEARAEFA